MMTKSKNIFQQEEEFLKLNAEIDSKTKNLMNEVSQIKENQLSNEKLHLDWSASEPVTQIETIEKQNLLELDAINKSSENNFALNDYLYRIKDSKNFLGVENSNDKKPEINSKKDLIRRSVRSSHSAKLTPSLVTAQVQTSSLALGITRHTSDLRLEQGKLENDVIPQTLKDVGHEGITRFLSAKVKLLTEQLEIIQKEEKKLLEKIKELQAHKDQSIEEREKLLQQANTTKNILIKYEKHANSLADQLQIAQTENCHLKKELEILKKEMQQSNKNHNAREIKLNRTLEEVDKLKATLQLSKQAEKEFKEMQRKKTEDLSNAIKTLDRQRLELLNGFKKQLMIIDNLKRQKDLIEAGKLLKSAENDFVSYLDSNPPNTVRPSGTLKSAKN